MLSVYTRHAQNCEHWDDINWRRCRCPSGFSMPPYAIRNLLTKGFDLCRKRHLVYSNRATTAMFSVVNTGLLRPLPSMILSN
jgi:hypothetical protein